jgi:aquaporin Z
MATVVTATAAAGERTSPVHWPEALMEALGLGLFMVSAGAFGTLLEFPGSPLHRALPEPFVRRALMGVLMGLTAIGLVYSPWGKRSGAHINPAFTWTFFRLGRIRGRDALAYTLAQFAGGLVGAALVAAVAGATFLDAPVQAVATSPGAHGVVVAFLAELSISGALVFLVLTLGRFPRIAPFTGLFVGATVCLYITFEAPLSGMSMNPARTFASAALIGHWGNLWLYFVAPPLGMLLATEAHLALGRKPGCAKLFHRLPCIFCGGKPAARSRGGDGVTGVKA